MSEVQDLVRPMKEKQVLKQRFKISHVCAIEKIQ